jgi:hypothetical protein
MIAASLEALARPGDVEDLDQVSELGVVQDWIALINEVKSSIRSYPDGCSKVELESRASE